MFHTEAHFFFTYCSRMSVRTSTQRLGGVIEPFLWVFRDPRMLEPFVFVLICIYLVFSSALKVPPQVS